MSKSMTLTLVTTLGKGYISLSDNNIIEGDLKKPEENIFIDNSENYYRPIKCSELYNKLKSKSWGNFGIKYVSTAKDEYPTVDEDGVTNFTIRAKITDPSISGISSEIPEILTSSLKDRINSDEIYSSGYKVTGNSFNASERELIDNTFTNLFGSMNEVNDIYFYRPTNSVIDLSNSAVTFNLINKDQGIYVNTLNFNELINHAIRPNLSAICTISIMFYTNDSMVGGKPIISINDFTFEVFKYKSDEDNHISLTIDDFVSKIASNNIQVEYFNGELRVVPTVNNIIECIIGNCTITYGNLQLKTNRFR